MQSNFNLKTQTGAGAGNEFPLKAKTCRSGSPRVFQRAVMSDPAPSLDPPFFSLLLPSGQERANDEREPGGNAVALGMVV